MAKRGDRGRGDAQRLGRNCGVCSRVLRPRAAASKRLDTGLRRRRPTPAQRAARGRRRHGACTLRLRQSRRVHPLLPRRPSRRSSLAAAQRVAVSAGATSRLCLVVAAAPRCRRTHLGCPDPSSARDVAYRKAFATAFPGLPASVAGNLLVLPYYNAVEAVCSRSRRHGETGAGRARLRAALGSLRLATPGGPSGSITTPGSRPRRRSCARRHGARRAVLPFGAQDSRRWTRRSAACSHRVTRPARRGMTATGHRRRPGLADSGHGRLDRPGEPGFVARGRETAGRKPRRTSSVAPASRATSALRAGPSPSCCQRRERPTTTRPMPVAAAARDPGSGATSNGSAATPTVRWIAIDALASNRLASRPAPSPVDPASTSASPRRGRQPGSELDRGPVVLGARERDQHRAVARPADQDRDVAGRLGENRHQMRVVEQSAPATRRAAGRCPVAGRDARCPRRRWRT